MTITRGINGQEVTFKLTPQEMSAAFFEQQHAFDEEDIEWAIEDYTDDDCMEDYGVTLEEFRNLIPRIARRFRKYIDNDDGWADTREWAILDYIRYEKEVESRVNA